MPKATWHGTLLAESDRCIAVENNWYFPPNAVQMDHLQLSATHSICSWKGTASYYDVVVGGEINRDAAWTYLDPKPAAREIRGYIAFWKGISVED